MSCPDEDTYARFLEGLLSPDQSSAIERHIDGCPHCRELSAQFGRLYARDPTPAPLPRPTLRLAAVELVMVAIHVAAIALAPQPAFQLWMAVGGAMALGAAWGLAGRHRWAPRLAAWHAWVALPSIVLTPLAILQLRDLRQFRRR